jgi:hypothetical protein
MHFLTAPFHEGQRRRRVVHSTGRRAVAFFTNTGDEAQAARPLHLNVSSKVQTHRVKPICDLFSDTGQVRLKLREDGVCALLPCC